MLSIMLIVPLICIAGGTILPICRWYSDDNFKGFHVLYYFIMIVTLTHFLVSLGASVIIRLKVHYT